MFLRLFTKKGYLLLRGACSTAEGIVPQGQTSVEQPEEDPALNRITFMQACLACSRDNSQPYLDPLKKNCTSTDDR